MNREEYNLTGNCLLYLFLSEILQVGAIMVAFVPLFGFLVSFLLNLAGIALAVYGPYQARNVHPNFNNALYVAFVTGVVSVIGRVIPQGGVLSGIFNIVTAVLSFLNVYFICTAAAQVLETRDVALAARADMIWKVIALCEVVSIIATLTSWIPLLNILTSLLGAIVGIIGIVVAVVRIVFYYQAANVLRAG